MDVKHLRAFAAVAEQGSFTKAAIALDLSQSHVTMLVRKLEERLGAVLFDRLARGVRLTEAGRILLPFAHRIEALFAEAEASVATSLTRSTLSIAAHESITIYRLPELLMRLRKLQPELDIRVTTVEEAKIPQVAIQGAIDVAFVFATNRRGDRANEILLEESSPVIVCSPQLETTVKGQLSFADLEMLDALVALPSCPGRLSFERMIDRANAPFPRIRELASVEAIKQCALRGLGYGVLPRVAVQGELRGQELIELRPFEPLDKVATMLVFSPEKTRTLNAFVTAARSLYRTAS